MFEPVNSDMEIFIAHAELSWIEVKKGNAKAANAEERKNSKIVNTIHKNGDVVEFLPHMLTHESSAVRYASAAYLINFDKERVIPVLCDISKEPTGLITPAASAVLRVNGVNCD